MSRRELAHPLVDGPGRWHVLIGEIVVQGNQVDPAGEAGSAPSALSSEPKNKDLPSWRQYKGFFPSAVPRQQ